MQDAPADGHDPSGVRPGGAGNQAGTDAGKQEPARAAPDPEKTVTNPVFDHDPEATLSGPVAEPDPEATVRMPVPEPDPEATVRMPLAAADAEATLTGPIDADLGIAIPAPGRRRNPFAPSQAREAVQANLTALGGLNPLIAVANPILGAVPQIRRALRHPDPARLRQTLRDQLEAFEANAEAAGVPADATAAANYALCALLDESAASTPWGGDWTKTGLLHDLHGEGWGGEKFFMLLAKTADERGHNRDLLEFLYVCLALGYEGRYRVIDDGARELDEIRGRLYELVRRRRPVRALSEHWRGATPVKRPGRGSTSVLWGVAAVSLLALGVHQLAERAPVGPVPGPVPGEAVKPGPVPLVAVAPVGVKPATRSGVAEQLENEVKRNLVAVTESAGRSTIEIRDERQFAPASARVAARLQPILVRIGEALERMPGKILVTGHADALPIHGGRFPSNQTLAEARAQAAAKLLAAKLSDPRRVSAEGRADREPMAPNDSNANRARNRRVVIVLESVP